MSGHEEGQVSKAGAGIRLGTKKEDLPVNKLFRALIDLNGSDLHLQVGKPAILRVKGSLSPLDMPPIDEDKMRELCWPLMDERNQEIFKNTGGADFAHVVEHKGEPWRFRVNLFIQMSKMGMVTRKVERSIPNFEGLFLPPILESLCVYDQGMVLLAGVTGSGKSTTLYAALQAVGREHVNVITVEDPIEYELSNARQIQTLPQIGFGFPEALKHILRHDPDVIMIGEMRDAETCKIAVESALTGHYSQAKCAAGALYRDPRGGVELTLFPARGIALWPDQYGYDFAALHYFAHPPGLPHAPACVGRH